MQHVDPLSRNPASNEPPQEEVDILHINTSDWVLAGQLIDKKLQHIHTILTKTPETPEERLIYKNYTLRDGRIYRITAGGIQWVVPHGMRHQVVRMAHDELGHFSTHKTLVKICENYWFPRMKSYVEKYIACCIPCLFNKNKPGRPPGFLHPIKKHPIPFHTLHMDHVGPFVKSKKRTSTYW